MEHELGSDARDEVLARLATVEDRLGRLASVDTQGLTDADPDTGERWEAAQAWAHMAEFPGYWLSQIRRVLERPLPEPVPFGRVKTDQGRLEGIETGRHEPTETLHERVVAALEEVEDFLSGLPSERWSARGTHPTLGEMTVREIVDRFLVRHLEEHAEQLEGLQHRA